MTKRFNPFCNVITEYRMLNKLKELIEQAFSLILLHRI